MAGRLSVPARPISAKIAALNVDFAVPFPAVPPHLDCGIRDGFPSTPFVPENPGQHRMSHALVIF
jgi:hypothetical protein